MSKTTDPTPSSAADAAAHPMKVGPYVLERPIGAGGMGTVYYARHEESGREAAVKVLPAALAREPGFVARFTREVEALKQLRNPHVVELLESGVDHDTYYYAMEYVDGETLTARLRRERRIPWTEVIAVSVQICNALKAAHNAGIIHRDLKPSNLMLKPDGTVKLADFGVAQVFAASKLTITGGIIGTAEYMSPEQAQGKRAGKQSDIYSLGAVMYAMLTGRPPFTGKTTLDVARKHQTGQFDSPRMVVPDVPFWLDEVVCKCLEKKPEDRYPDAYVLSLRLQEIPRKVELSQRDQAVDFGDASATAETLSADAELVKPQVGGTLMRDLIRAESQRAADEPLSRALDNVWVLLGLLVLLVLGGIWWFSRQQYGPQERFARGEELMSRPAGPAWETARDEHFLPLLREDPQEWGPKVRPYLLQIRLSEMLARLRTPAGRNGNATTEPELFLNRAAELHESGETARAAATLQALQTLLGDDPQYAEVRPMIAEAIADLEGQLRNGPRPLLEDALERAARADAAGESGRAESIRRSIDVLYDPQTVEHARKRRADRASGNPSSTPTGPLIDEQQH